MLASEASNFRPHVTDRDSMASSASSASAAPVAHSRRTWSAALLNVVGSLARYERLDDEDVYELQMYSAEKEGCRGSFKVVFFCLVGLLASFLGFIVFYLYLWNNLLAATDGARVELESGGLTYDVHPGTHNSQQMDN